MVESDYQPYMIENNVSFAFSINDNKDVIVEISNKLEGLLVE